MTVSRARSAIVLRRLGRSLSIASCALLLPTFAAAQTDGPGSADSAKSAEGTPESKRIDTVEVTGSRIVREDFVANSPISTVTRGEIEKYSDITLETFLNTLPQVNPAGTITSNNPGNGGQANIDLRGLGANRNLVLIDGRRPMVSATDQSVDLNTIPMALIDRIEVITGGAGAVYGADAMAGAVNIILKKKYEGLDIRGSWIDTESEHDAQDRSFGVTFGKNLWKDNANLVVGLEYADREALIKSQRAFSQNATATTSFLPEGLYFPSGNNPTQASIDGVFGGYGDPSFVAGGSTSANSVNAAASLIGFNLDGTLFSRGVFNNPRNVINFRYPIDGSVNSTLFPDVYSYNFDFVNILVLPFERYSGMGSFSFEFENGVELFAQTQYATYSSATALAPSPIHTSNGRAPGENSASQWSSPLIAPGGAVTQLLVIPATNPFIPADFATLLASRTGDNANLVGSGATEPFLMRQRTLSAGLRQSINENTVYQTVVGLRGPMEFNNNVWNWEIYGSRGKTSIPQTQLGNINAQNLQTLLEAADGGVGTCSGGFNPFGRQPISQACLNFLQVVTNTDTRFDQDILSGFMRGDVGQLPAGPVQLVLGAEHRQFKFGFVPGAVAGPIDGFNTQTPAAGSNSFRDIYMEALVPVVRDLPFAQAVDIGFGYRISRSKFEDSLSSVASTPATDSAFKVDLSWQIVDAVRSRLSYQRAVRAPNFGELFSGGSSAPQYFDPCSATTARRVNDVDDPVDVDTTPEFLELCQAVGAGANGDGIAGGAGMVGYVQTPGTQLNINTAGNTDLEPEKGDTLTIGAVFKPTWEGLRGDLTASLDYYQIKIGSPILVPDPNLIVASCYNYFGTNPNLDPTDPNCGALIRFGATDLLAVLFPGDPANGVFPGLNSGSVRVSGFDAAVNYGIGLDSMGALAFDLRINRVLEFKQQDPGLPEIDYAGTASYFGQGLGASSPEWKLNLNTRWTLGDYFFDARTRYIHGMDNRIAKQFPGESFSGPGAITYWDLGAGYRVSSGMVIRAGLVNALDKDPPVYSPNVQSGTDPSLYDVYGRRAYAQVNFSF